MSKGGQGSGESDKREEYMFVQLMWVSAWKLKFVAQGFFIFFVFFQIQIYSVNDSTNPKFQ